MSNSEFLKLKQLWQSYEQEWNEIIEKERQIYDSVSAAFKRLDAAEISTETCEQCEMLFMSSYKLLKETSIRKIDMFSSAFEKMGYDDEETEDQPEVNKE